MGEDTIDGLTQAGQDVANAVVSGASLTADGAKYIGSASDSAFNGVVRTAAEPQSHGHLGETELRKKLEVARRSAPPCVACCS